MFVSQELILEVGFPAALAGLGQLTRGGWLRDASGDAYAEGLAGLAGAGPFGDVLSASRLVRVSVLEPQPRAGIVILALRWEAIGVLGKLVPVLDANLELTPAGDAASRIVCTGAYRPPLVAPAAGLDRVMLRSAAIATVGGLLRRVRETVMAAQAPDDISALTALPADPDLPR
jgi:hypothetical protein